MRIFVSQVRKGEKNLEKWLQNLIFGKVNYKYFLQSHKVYFLIHVGDQIFSFLVFWVTFCVDFKEKKSFQKYLISGTLTKWQFLTSHENLN